MDKLVFISFLILFLVSAASASTDASISSVDPAVVAPGESFTVNVRLTNDGSESQYFQELELTEKDGFRVIEGLDLGGEELCQGCRSEDSARVRVLEDTVSGRYEFSVSPIDSEQGIGFSEDFRITVDGSPNLFFTLENSTLKGQKKGSANLNIENIGTETSYETEVSIKGEELETEPSRVNLGNIRPGESLEKTIEFETGTDPGVGLRTVSIKLYYREGSDTVSKEEELSIRVKKDIELAISDIQFSNPVQGEITRVLVELENTGIGEIESIRGKLECSNTTVINSKSFVGSLEEGESVPTVYRIKPVKADGECSLNVDYGDKEKQLDTGFNFKAGENNYRRIVLFAVPVALMAVIGLLWRRRNRGG